MITLAQHRKRLAEALSVLQLPPEAVEWLSDFFESLQLLDDWRDGDGVDKTDIESVIYIILAKLPSNPFFQAHANRLLPIISNLTLKWCGSNFFEERRDVAQLPKCYMWRAGFYDLVLEVVACVHGHRAAINAAPIVMILYGEGLEEYMKEFSDA